MDADKINEAVDHCVCDALENDEPLQRVAGFVEELRRRPGWSTEEVAAVELAARQQVMWRIGMLD